MNVFPARDPLVIVKWSPIINLGETLNRKTVNYKLLTAKCT